MARRRRTRLSSWNAFWLWTAAAAALVLGVSAIWLAIQAERKLSALALGGLGESFSTRLWSAPALVADGAPAETTRLLERLDRLEYRRVDGSPAKGEYRWNPPELTVFLRGCIFFGWMVSFLLSMALIGLIPTVPIFVVAFMRIEAREPWKIVVPMAVFMTIFIYFLFDWLLSIPWPGTLLGSGTFFEWQTGFKGLAWWKENIPSG